MVEINCFGWQKYKNILSSQYHNIYKIDETIKMSQVSTSLSTLLSLFLFGEGPNKSLKR